jgi:hypothetical protein
MLSQQIPWAPQGSAVQAAGSGRGRRQSSRGSCPAATAGAAAGATAPAATARVASGTRTGGAVAAGQRAQARAPAGLVSALWPARSGQRQRSAAGRTARVGMAASGLAPPQLAVRGSGGAGGARQWRAWWTMQSPSTEATARNPSGRSRRRGRDLMALLGPQGQLAGPWGLGPRARSRDSACRPTSARSGRSSGICRHFQTTSEGRAPPLLALVLPPQEGGGTGVGCHPKGGGVAQGWQRLRPCTRACVQAAPGPRLVIQTPQHPSIANTTHAHALTSAPPPRVRGPRRRRDGTIPNNSLFGTVRVQPRKGYALRRPRNSSAGLLGTRYEWEEWRGAASEGDSEGDGMGSSDDGTPQPRQHARSAAAAAAAAAGGGRAGAGLREGLGSGGDGSQGRQQQQQGGQKRRPRDWSDDDKEPAGQLEADQPEAAGQLGAQQQRQRKRLSQQAAAQDGQGWLPQQQAEEEGGLQETDEEGEEEGQLVFWLGARRGVSRRRGAVVSGALAWRLGPGAGACEGKSWHAHPH